MRFSFLSFHAINVFLFSLARGCSYVGPGLAGGRLGAVGFAVSGCGVVNLLILEFGPAPYLDRGLSGVLAVSGGGRRGLLWVFGPGAGGGGPPGCGGVPPRQRLGCLILPWLLSLESGHPIFFGATITNSVCSHFSVGCFKSISSSLDHFFPDRFFSSYGGDL